MPLIFYISPQWKQKNNNLSNRKSSTDSIHLTINLNKINNSDQNIRTARDFDEILNDIETYRNELYDTHGSIHIEIYSFETKRCCCDRNQSNEICKQISKYENELFQNDFVEYIYHIDFKQKATEYKNMFTYI